MANYDDIDKTEKNIMEAMGYHWNGHGWQRALSGNGSDMTIEGWAGPPPKNPEKVTRIWDQKISGMNKSTTFNEDEDFIEPMPEGLKDLYREESDDKIKYASTLETDLTQQIKYLDKDRALLQNQISQLSPHVSELENAKMRLSLNKIIYQKVNAELLLKEATKRRIHEQYMKQNNEYWFLSLEKPTGAVLAKKKEIYLELGKYREQEQKVDAQIVQEKKKLAAARKDVENQQKQVNELTVKEKEQIKDALKLTADFYKITFEKFGKNASTIAEELSNASRGKQIQNVNDALKSFDKFRNNLNKKYSLKDRQAISRALESINRSEMAKNFNLFSKSFGFISKPIVLYDLLVELKKAIGTDNWRPFFVKAESLAAGKAATAITAWTFSVLLGTPVGIVGFAIIMAAMNALINDKFTEQINKLIGV